MTVVSLDMAYCSFREVLAGLDTRLDTPPSIDSHHPDSGLAPGQSAPLNVLNWIPPTSPSIAGTALCNFVAPPVRALPPRAAVPFKCGSARTLRVLLPTGARPSPLSPLRWSEKIRRSREPD